MALINDLTQLGLTDKEAEVYLAALELGPCNIQALAKKSGIKRSTVYEMLKNLKAMNLVAETTKGKRKLVVAAEPENLKRSIKAKEKLLTEMLPELKSLSNVGAIKPKITFYEGKDGIKEIFRDTLRTKVKITYWISPIKSITDNVGEDFLNKYVEDRVKAGLWVNSIHISSQIADYKYVTPEHHESTLRKVRFTPLEIDIPDSIAIYGSKVAIMSSKKEGFGLVIESEDLAKTMRVFHELLWKTTKTYEEIYGGAKEAVVV